jgi:hypothetical protein
MKLVNLIPLHEIDFKNQDAFDSYQKQHKLRPDTKVTIAGKVTTAGKASQASNPTKGASVFGKNSGASVFGKSTTSTTTNDYQGAVRYYDKNGKPKIKTFTDKAKAEKFADDNDSHVVTSKTNSPTTPSTPTVSDKPKAEKSKYDDAEYWKDDEKSDSLGGYYDSDDEDDDDYGYDDEEAGDGVALTSNRLDKVESALEDELKLSANGFETTRESSGGSGGWEGPMTIVSDDADQDSGNYISLSVGSPENDGKFSITFANDEGKPYFESGYDALTGNDTLDSQQAFKITKTLMKMPEVQKLLKGKMKMDEFQPIYDKLKSQIKNR